MAFHFTTHALVRVVLFRVWRLAKQARFLLAFFPQTITALLLHKSYGILAGGWIQLTLFVVKL